MAAITYIAALIASLAIYSQAEVKVQKYPPPNKPYKPYFLSGSEDYVIFNDKTSSDWDFVAGDDFSRKHTKNKGFDDYYKDNKSYYGDAEKFRKASTHYHNEEPFFPTFGVYDYQRANKNLKRGSDVGRQYHASEDFLEKRKGNADGKRKTVNDFFESEDHSSFNIYKPSPFNFPLYNDPRYY